MAIQLLLAATLRKFLPDYDAAIGHSVDVAPGCKVRDIAHQLGIPEAEVRIILVNGVSAKWDTILNGDERVALFPPVGGG